MVVSRLDIWNANASKCDDELKRCPWWHLVREIERKKPPQCGVRRSSAQVLVRISLFRGLQGGLRLEVASLGFKMV